MVFSFYHYKWCISIKFFKTSCKFPFFVDGNDVIRQHALIAYATWFIMHYHSRKLIKLNMFFYMHFCLVFDKSINIWSRNLHHPCKHRRSPRIHYRLLILSLEVGNMSKGGLTTIRQTKRLSIYVNLYGLFVRKRLIW